MRTWIIVMLFSLVTVSAKAQTWDEWFKQKKTQIKYLVQQIAALQAYTDVLQKGYHIARDGLHTIGDIKNGEFHLHGDYFNSLKSINPAIAKYPKIAGIIALEVSIVQECKKVNGVVKQGSWFTLGEVDYVGRVFANLLQGCSDNIEALTQLTTAGKLEMSDDERLQRIDALYEDTRDKYSFVQDFGNGTRLLAVARAKDKQETAVLKKMYGLNN